MNEALLRDDVLAPGEEGRPEEDVGAEAEGKKANKAESTCAPPTLETERTARTRYKRRSGKNSGVSHNNPKKRCSMRASQCGRGAQARVRENTREKAEKTLKKICLGCGADDKRRGEGGGATAAQVGDAQDS